MPEIKERSADQIERQKEEHRERGKYAKVHPCYVCEKSAGINYYSHPDTDGEINDELLVLCKKCYNKCGHLKGKEAVKLMFPEQGKQKMAKIVCKNCGHESDYCVVATSRDKEFYHIGIKPNQKGHFDNQCYAIGCYCTNPEPLAISEKKIE